MEYICLPCFKNIFSFIGTLLLSPLKCTCKYTRYNHIEQRFQKSVFFLRVKYKNSINYFHYLGLTKKKKN